jgi:16S rRNA (guanine(966)-N(2))-methyltransferase RsmD
MSVLGAHLEDALVLDLFAGSGALGLEALSRGARRATFVERDRRVLQYLRENIAALGAEDQATVVAGDVFRYLDSLAPGAFDLALADPPYGVGLARRIVARYLKVPFAGILSVEHAPAEALDLPQGAEVRRYGDTALAFIAAADLVEEGR